MKLLRNEEQHVAAVTSKQRPSRRRVAEVGPVLFSMPRKAWALPGLCPIRSRPALRCQLLSCWKLGDKRMGKVAGRTWFLIKTVI